MYTKLLVALISVASIACLGASSTFAAVYSADEGPYSTPFQAKSKATKFTMNSQSVECAKAVLKGITPTEEGSTTEKVKPTYEECKSILGKTTVTNENCEYNLEEPEQTKANVYAISYGIIAGSTKASCLIAIKIVVAGLTCEIAIEGQKGLKTFKAKDLAAETEEVGVTLTAEVTNLTYTAKGTACSAMGIKSGSAGEYKSEVPPYSPPPRMDIGARFGSVPLNMQSSFQGEILAGTEHVFEFTKNLQIECMGAKWQGSLLGLTLSLAVKPEFTECTATGGFAVDPVAHGECTYVFSDPRPGGNLEYVSTMRVVGAQCGTVLTFKFEVAENVICEIRIPAQGPRRDVSIEYGNVNLTNELEARAAVTNLEYFVPNGNCGAPGVGGSTSGKYKGTVKMTNMKMG